ncbi:MAG: hypothetical protein HYW34_02230 [Candidatus Brennerbacteria bacterium]|nr:hypothetical protein [Candidatus Brennerbacteria bacterium]
MDITKKLKLFQDITPDREYAQRARFLILSAKKNETSQERFYGYLKFVFAESRLAAASMAIIAVIAIFVVYGYFNDFKVQQANNNEEEGLQIAQTQYYQPTAQNVSFFSRIEQRVGDFFDTVF